MSRPTLHAALNLTAATLLVLGWMAIRGRGVFATRGRDEGLHKRFMLAAVAVSTVFLASYVEYHATVGSVAFWGTGWLRALYLTILLPHIVLAAVIFAAIYVWIY